ncbi:hypothetical protein HPB51_000906 [Rhipicephalus microplus]|uniref:Single-strand selective monofunctional uracil dna glycosylase n=1 Tax=Rhipicephalus microplus TaxID=6941 RepID=A0A9J6DKX6_RHIMP|nr:hypothetical protein HPB51_000906 [Rhipicephalus microplus]
MACSDAAADEIADAFLAIEQQQSELLSHIPYGSKVSHVYNPLEYARETHECYVRKYCRTRKTVLFLGMNPGPFGMAQNGVSGHRFWGLLREITGGGELLRGPWFVHNYCPLAFLLPSGANLTPNKLRLESRQHLQA